jgi:RNA-directed DNA polymerase
MIKVSEIKIKSKINWRKIQLRIWRIQKKIYDCSRRTKKFEVIRSQKVLISLSEAKLLAVRKVIQDNRGKKIAGVDGMRLLAPTKRFHLAYSLK